MRSRHVIAVAALLVLAGCGRSGGGADAPKLTHITFVTDWKAQAEHGGFYEALAEGLYKKRGLDVTIVEGGPQVNVAQLLAGGAADFGIGSNSFIPLNLVRAGAPHQGGDGDFPEGPAGADHPSARPT